MEAFALENRALLYPTHYSSSNGKKYDFGLESDLFFVFSSKEGFSLENGLHYFLCVKKKTTSQYDPFYAF
jgi:hypothetical protein